MDEHNRLARVMTEASKVCDDMRLILQDAFGPNGRAVMLQNSNGHLTITRSGEEILKSAFSHNSQTPICNLFLKLISEIHDEIGDGVKYFIFIVSSMLNYLKLHCNGMIIKELQKVEIIVNNIANQPIGNEREFCLSKIISTFFSTRFTKIVANYLSKLTFEFVTNLSLFTSKEIVKYFPVLCVTFCSLPLSASEIKDGLLFKGLVSNNFVKAAKCLVKVYLYPEEEKPDDGEVESDVSNLILNINSENCAILFITNVFLPDRAMYLLHLKHIIIVHGVGLEETHFLSEYILKYSIEDLITEFKLKDNYVWISLPGVFQFIINAPNNDFASQYKSSIKNCLKLISFAASKSTMICKVGGYFERKFVLHMNLFSDNKLLPPVCGRKELNIWLKMKSELCDTFAKECKLEGNSSKQNDSLNNINFNMFIKNISNEISNSVSGSNVLKALGFAMWDVASKLSEQQDGFEFVIVKLAVLSKAMSFVVMISQTDELLQIGNKSSIVSSVVKY